MTARLPELSGFGVRCGCQRKDPLLAREAFCESVVRTPSTFSTYKSPMTQARPGVGKVHSASHTLVSGTRFPAGCAPPCRCDDDAATSKTAHSHGADCREEDE
jgi:hypothetical protein